MKPRAAAIIVLALTLALALAAPRYLSDHQVHVLVQILLFAYLSSCWNILGGFTGQLSFGHALFMAVGAYTSTLLLLHFGLSPWLGMLAGGALAAILGLFIGYLSFRYGIKGTYFVLVTLAFTEIARIVALNTPAIGGALGLYIAIKSDNFWQLKFVNKSNYFYVILALLLLVLAVSAWLERSRTGHRLIAIRENEGAAEALGINLLRYKLFATALSAFLTALGGTFYAHYVTFIDPNTLLNMNMALEITIYSIVGGIGTLVGPLLGAAFLVPIAEWVRVALGNNYAGIHLVVYGLILMAVIRFAPDGLLGLIKFMRSKWAGSGRAATALKPQAGRS
jgi:branched-chain amino acid transport system permease protein